jgi:hypothetical protein
MSRDEWGRANARVKYGPAPPKKTWEDRKRRKGKKRAANRMDAHDFYRRFNSHSKLGFGCYGNQEIGTIPVDYLRWVIRTFKPRSARMRGLVAFLSDYLSH